VNAPPAPVIRTTYSSGHNTLLPGPLEPGQYTSFDYTQTLNDHQVLASVGSVGDAYDNALAESFVDSFKTELIADRVWRSRAQLELATVEYIGWFNTARLHSALGYLTPAEHETAWSTARARALLAQAAPTASELPALASGLSDG
jgi:putative transposase